MIRLGVLTLVALVPALAVAPPAGANQVLMVIGIEYTCYPDHYCVSGIWSSLDQFAWNGQWIPPYTERAADILALSQKGNNPLWWFAHPNWKDFYTVPQQINNLLGVISATGNTWYPDGIGFLNLVGGPPWRRQVSIEMANPYSQQVPVSRIPAFLLEVDFHNRPSLWYQDCGEPYTLVWVPANWRSLPPNQAMEEVFRAIRERRALGTVGAARFSSLEIASSNMTLTLTEPIEHVQLWAGGSEPVGVWENTASASFNLSSLAGSEHFVHWFAYGDSVAGQWNTWACQDKEVFFTSPIVRNGQSWVNQYAAAALQGRIPIKVLLHHHTSISNDGAPGFTFSDLFTECQQLGIDCVLTTDHNPPAFLGPLPGFVSAWDVIPPAVAVWGEAPEQVTMEALTALPNPVAAGRQLTVRYELASPARVTLRVYDVAGRMVAVAKDGPAGPGRHEERLDLGGRPSGEYFLRLDVGGRAFTKRVTLVE